jgi:hypothetical protein
LSTTRPTWFSRSRTIQCESTYVSSFGEKRDLSQLGKKDFGANYSMDDDSENFMTQLPTYKFYKMISGTDMISRKEFMMVPIIKFLQFNFVLFLRPAEGRLIFLPYHLSVILKVISCSYLGCGMF